ncbi:hypothetical protein [Thalassobaculum sp.]|uniref:hypothetical protein n=1 Tax=Thalassobaculum sp. TaxID=2022740 RepID=UPI0032EC0A25
MILREFNGLDSQAIVAIGDALRRINLFRYRAKIPIKLSLDQYYRMSISDEERAFVKLVLTFFWSSALPQIYQRTFRREPMLILDLCKFRAQRPEPGHGYAPWHLDANFYGFDIPMLTAWMPLVDVGVDAPGLDFRLPSGPVDDARIRAFWEDLPVNARGGRTIDDQQVADLVGTDHRELAPILKTGNCVIFDQHVLHRTQILPGATKAREAIEFRIVARDQAPTHVMEGRAADLLGSYPQSQTGQITITALGKLFPQLSNQPS